MELLVVILAVGVLLYGVVTAGGRAKSSRGVRIDRELIARKWSDIQAMTSSNRWSQAVAEADKLLDYAMKASGFRGTTMGDRLKADGRRFSDLDSIWRAHKLRNSFAHDVSFDVVPSQAKEALRDFERGLKDLGAL